jgi:ADP-heptose:LPS heptosyltransferase
MIRNGKKSDQCKKILAINFGGIGDEILFLPTLETIRENMPNASITLLLEPRSRSVQELTDLVDNVITFDIKKRPLAISDLLELLSLIKEGAYDCVVSSGGSAHVSALLFLSGIRERVGYKSGRIGKMLLTEPVPLVRKQYAAGMYHDLAIGFLKQQDITPPVVTEEKLIPKVILKEESIERMNTFLDEKIPSRKSRQHRLIVVHPGTSRLATEKGIIKTWPTEQWIELLQRIFESNVDKEWAERDIVILAGGPDDDEIIKSIETGLAQPAVRRHANTGTHLKSLIKNTATNMQAAPPRMISAYGRTKNIADLAALMHLSDLVVCVDSAPMHIAVGLDKPLVALFGPTDPALLLPNKERFKFIWDSRNGIRSMFDGLGVTIASAEVFNAITSHDLKKLESVV